MPAIVSLFGRWNWWLPERPARLLRRVFIGDGLAQACQVIADYADLKSWRP